MRAGAAGPRRERDAQRHASEGSCRAVGRVPGEPRGGAPWCPTPSRVRGRSAPSNRHYAGTEPWCSLAGQHLL